MNNNKYPKLKRVAFPKGEQGKFLNQIKNTLKFTWSELARKLKVHPRSLSDWKQERYLLPLNVIKKICKLAEIELPNNIEIKEPFWSTSKAGKIAGNKTYKKYGVVGGDQEYRKKKWQEWWEKEGRNKSDNIVNCSKSFSKPVFSGKLAEFVGIMLGDGSITLRQIIITLHYKDDKEYGEFVSLLIKKLFNVPVNKNYREKYSINTFVVSRSGLVKFCVEKLGLKIGSKIKQQVGVPDWIKHNKKYIVPCVRGLMDTDGSVFGECHNIKGKKYCYPRLCFTSFSEPLIDFMFSALSELGFSPKIRSHNKKVQIENYDDIIRYFKLIKSNNPKHKRRLEIFLEESDSG